MAESPDILPTSGLESILGSTARLRVAKLLVELPDKEFTGREIGRLLAMSHSSVLDALRVLTDYGLATERVLGRAHVFRVNRDYFLYTLLANLFRSERDQRRRIAEVIRGSLASSSISVVLFGSRAMEGARKHSDLDLLVVAKDVNQAESALSHLRARLRRTYGLDLDAKVLTLGQLKSKLGAPFVRAGLAEGILIGGVPLEKVLESAA
ncbi:MAG TPA: nucleotidyltransferase domain-containing protein [Thermoplasmata archaeon]